MKTGQIPLDADLVAVIEEVGRPAKDSVRELVVMELYRLELREPASLSEVATAVPVR